MAQTTLCSARDVEIVAEELGIECKVFTDINHLMALGSTAQLDPDIIYLYDPDQLFLIPQRVENTNMDIPLNAMLKYQGMMKPLQYEKHTTASLRKMLLNSGDTKECIVCCESEREDGDRSFSHCPRCNAAACVDCAIKSMLTPEVTRRILHGDFSAMTKCAECKKELLMDIRETYHTVFHLLKEFTKPQQQVLVFLKEMDDNYQYKHLAIKYMIRMRIDIMSRCFKQGCCVTLYGLQKKKEWNGQRAIIIGDKSIKNGPIRWPIQLLNQTKTKALIKQCHLRKIVSEKRQ